MNWFKKKIRRYEIGRWTTDENGRVRRFEWGIEHIGGRADEADPRGFLANYSRQAIANSKEWYAAEAASDYRLDAENVLAFSSSIESPWPENNTGYGQLFPGKARMLAEFVLPNWNAK